MKSDHHFAAEVFLLVLLIAGTAAAASLDNDLISASCFTVILALFLVAKWLLNRRFQ